MGHHEPARPGRGSRAREPRTTALQRRGGSWSQVVWSQPSRHGRCSRCWGCSPGSPGPSRRRAWPTPSGSRPRCGSSAPAGTSWPRGRRWRWCPSALGDRGLAHRRRAAAYLAHRPPGRARHAVAGGPAAGGPAPVLRRVCRADRRARAGQLGGPGASDRGRPGWGVLRARSRPGGRPRPARGDPSTHRGRPRRTGPAVAAPRSASGPVDRGSGCS